MYLFSGAHYYQTDGFILFLRVLCAYVEKHGNVSTHPSCLLVFCYQKCNDSKRKEKKTQYSLFSVPLFSSLLVVPSITAADTTLHCYTTTFLFLGVHKYRGFTLTSPFRDTAVCVLGEIVMQLFKVFSLFHKQTLLKRVNVKGGLFLLMADCIFHQAQISSGFSGCSVT